MGRRTDKGKRKSVPLPTGPKLVIVLMATGEGNQGQSPGTGTAPPTHFFPKKCEWGDLTLLLDANTDFSIRELGGEVQSFPQSRTRSCSFLPLESQVLRASEDLSEATVDRPPASGISMAAHLQPHL